MVDTSSDATTDRWLCPDDRQLALRGRLDTGWSTFPDGHKRASSSIISDQEKMVIQDVMRRAIELDIAEQIRIGALVDNVEQTKRSLHGDGVSSCLVCGYKSGFLKDTLRKCGNCGRLVCTKCRMGGTIKSNPFDGGKCVYCVVCFEEKELWKRSGAWFFKMLPRYITPEERMERNYLRKETRRELGSTGSSPSYDPDLQGEFVNGRRYSTESDDSDYNRELSASNDDLLHRESRVPRHQFDAQDSDDGSQHALHSTPRIEIPVSAEAMSRRRYGVIANQSDSEDDDDLAPPVDKSRKSSTKSTDSVVSARTHTSEDYKKGGGSFRVEREHDDANTEISGDQVDGASLVRANEGRKSMTERPEYHGDLGMIEFRMQYVEKEQTLNIFIKCARGLKAMDYGKSSDPYVKLYIVPGHAKSTKNKTKVHYKTLNPSFNEDFSYFGITEKDLKRKMIRLVVMDENKLSSNAFIGETYVALYSLVNRPDQNFKRLLDPYTEHELGEKKDDYPGKIQIALLYIESKSQLIVGIERCVNLKPMDPNGYSDPYVKCYLIPDPKKTTKKKTKVIKKTLNPEFYEEFTYEIPKNKLAGKTLVVTVWDRDVGSSNDFIGCVSLGYSSREDALKHWFETLKFPDQKKIYWHTLSPEKPSMEDAD